MCSGIVRDNVLEVVIMVKMMVAAVVAVASVCSGIGRNNGCFWWRRR